MAVLEMVKPVIEFIHEDLFDGGWAPEVLREGERYEQWAASISEGWCPPDEPNPGPLAQVSFIATREEWLCCPHRVLFRLVYPNHLEEE